MMKKLLFLVLFILYSATSSANDGYVTVDPATLDTTNGKSFLFISYGIVIGTLVIYWLVMTLQKSKLTARIALLAQQMPEVTERKEL